MLPQKLAASSDCGIDKLQSTAGDHVARQPEKWHPPGSSETLKKEQEDAFISSCESAKTVCEVEAVLSGRASVRSGPKGTSEFPVAKVDHKELEAEPRADGDSPGDESCPRRPDYLKGLASFQQSHSTTASLGLAFPSQNGSAAVSRWPSLVDRNTEDRENLAFSPGYEPNHNQSADAHRYYHVFACHAPFHIFYYSFTKNSVLLETSSLSHFLQYEGGPKKPELSSGGQAWPLVVQASLTR